MTRGRSPNEVDQRLLAALPKLWAAGVETSDIADRFAVSDDVVRLYVRRLKLPPRERPRMYVWDKISRAENRRRHAAKLGCLHHRRAIQQPDPIILEPSPTLFGAPLKRLDEETRALIDGAIRGVRGKPAKKQKRTSAFTPRNDNQITN